MEPKEPDTVELAGTVEAAKAVSSEVALPRTQRRRFSVSEKLRILRLADDCAQGELGALLRREGIYASSLSKWRAQRERGSLASRRRGPKMQQGAPARAEKKKLTREIQKLRHELEKAQLIIEMQKKMAFLLSSSPPDDESKGGNS